MSGRKEMLFFLSWLIGYDLTVSTVNSLTCIALHFIPIDPIFNLINVWSYLLFDVVTHRLTRKSQYAHHLLGLISIPYMVFNHPEYNHISSLILVLLEVSTIFLNMYFDSKKTPKDKETPYLSGLLSTQSWSYLFLLCFIVCRFILYTYYLYPHMSSPDIIVLSTFWLILNTYWLYWMFVKFVLKKNNKKKD